MAYGWASRRFKVQGRTEAREWILSIEEED